MRELDAPNYYELYKRFGFRLDELAEECRDAARRDGEAVGARGRQALPLAARHRRSTTRGRGTWPRLFRAPELDQLYPADQMLPALEATLTDLGIDLRAQENVHLDLERAPERSRRARSARRSRCPGKVMLVIQPIGGKDDWEALFHEAGHTEHYAHTSATCRWRRSASATWPSPRAGRC